MLSWGLGYHKQYSLLTQLFKAFPDKWHLGEFHASARWGIGFGQVRGFSPGFPGHLSPITYGVCWWPVVMIHPSFCFCWAHLRSTSEQWLMHLLVTLPWLWFNLWFLLLETLGCLWKHSPFLPSTVLSGLSWADGMSLQSLMSPIALRDGNTHTRSLQTHYVQITTIALFLYVLHVLPVLPSSKAPYLISRKHRDKLWVTLL